MNIKCALCNIVEVEDNLNGAIFFSDRSDVKYRLCYGCMNFLHSDTTHCTLIMETCRCPWCALERHVNGLDGCQSDVVE